MNVKVARERAIKTVKKLLYGARGEPIQYGPHKLRYLPGSRPVRLKYASSTDIVARNDALQIQFVLQSVRPGQLVLNVGAHYGEYAVLFAALVGPTGRVISLSLTPPLDPYLARTSP